MFQEVPWFWGSRGFFVTTWFPDIHGNIMVVSRMLVWVRFHNLPLHFWLHKVIEANRNRLQRYRKKYTQIFEEKIYTIRQLFNSVKDPINHNLQKGVYVIPCSCGKEYIGERGRYFNIRIKEHTADLRRERTSKLALAEHVHYYSHYICMEEIKLVRKEDHYLERKIKEAIKIEKIKNENNLNEDDGLKLRNT